MHPEADAFLDAIFDHPNDDTPRLVYADWLQEHGEEPLAEFVRARCAIALLGNHQPRPLQLREREKKAWEAIKNRWPEFIKFTDAKKEWFHRGFFRGRLALNEDTFFLHYPEWMQWFPAGDLQLSGYWRDQAQITGRPELLARVSYLKIESVVDFPASFLINLARHPRLKHLRYLSIDTVRASRDALIELVNAPWLSNLHLLSLSVRVNAHNGGPNFESCGGFSPSHKYGAGQLPIRERVLAYVEASAAHFLE